MPIHAPTTNDAHPKGRDRLMEMKNTVEDHLTRIGGQLLGDKKVPNEEEARTQLEVALRKALEGTDLELESLMVETDFKLGRKDATFHVMARVREGTASVLAHVFFSNLDRSHIPKDAIEEAAQGVKDRLQGINEVPFTGVRPAVATALEVNGQPQLKVGVIARSNDGTPKARTSFSIAPETGSRRAMPVSRSASVSI